MVNVLRPLKQNKGFEDSMNNKVWLLLICLYITDTVVAMENISFFPSRSPSPMGSPLALYYPATQAQAEAKNEEISQPSENTLSGNKPAQINQDESETFYDISKFLKEDSDDTNINVASSNATQMPTITQNIDQLNSQHQPQNQKKSMLPAPPSEDLAQNKKTDRAVAAGYIEILNGKRRLTSQARARIDELCATPDFLVPRNEQIKMLCEKMYFTLKVDRKKVIKYLDKKPRPHQVFLESAGKNLVIRHIQENESECWLPESTKDRLYTRLFGGYSPDYDPVVIDVLRKYAKTKNLKIRWPWSTYLTLTTGRYVISKENLKKLYKDNSYLSPSKDAQEIIDFLQRYNDQHAQKAPRNAHQITPLNNPPATNNINVAPNNATQMPTITQNTEQPSSQHPITINRAVTAGYVGIINERRRLTPAAKKLIQNAVNQHPDHKDRTALYKKLYAQLCMEHKNTPKRIRDRKKERDRKKVRNYVDKLTMQWEEENSDDASKKSEQPALQREDLAQNKENDQQPTPLNNPRATNNINIAPNNATQIPLITQHTDQLCSQRQQQNPRSNPIVTVQKQSAPPIHLNLNNNINISRQPSSSTQTPFNSTAGTRNNQTTDRIKKVFAELGKCVKGLLEDKEEELKRKSNPPDRVLESIATKSFNTRKRKRQ